MQHNKAYKFRLYPTRQQQEQIFRTFGCCRFVYNHYLDKRKTLYEEQGKKMSFFDCTKDLTILKKELTWLGEVELVALRYSIKDLDFAFQNFFRGAGYPKFKSKKGSHRHSYRSDGSNISFSGNKVKLPKLGWVKCKVSQPIKGRILNATISQTPSGKFFVSICCTEVEIQPLPKLDNAVGVDLGYRNLATLSDGTIIPNGKYRHKYEKQLARQQKNLSRKVKGSNNYEKQRKKVAKLHEKITNCRKYNIHNITTRLIRENQVICLEDLDVMQMMQKPYQAKFDNDVGYYEFKRQLLYKADWYGREIREIPKDFPSSQICNVCGKRNTKVGSRLTWTCANCGAKHHRDVNAAKNILSEGLKMSA
ncbi:MAG: IS200/IS605 family element RNA-guided endonuclease TnpB [Clostridia bacterium]|nr:IS200/IS605 family element RNA-guided endonuclease TnpB [Clostridia bacterium]